MKLQTKKNKLMLKKLGYTIQDQREFLDMSRADLADRCGLTVRTIAKIEESGTNIYISTMLAICDALDLTAADLWDIVEHELEDEDD